MHFNWTASSGGNLVNKNGDADEIAEYKRVLKQLDPSIPVYSVAGNHDIGNEPTPASIEAFRNQIGRFLRFRRRLSVNLHHKSNAPQVRELSGAWVIPIRR